MASAILVADPGDFNVSQVGVEFFHGAVSFVVIGQDALLYESPLFKLRGIDVQLTIGGTPSVGRPKPRTKGKYELRGGGPHIVPVQKFPGRASLNEEEEILFLIQLFLHNRK